MKRNRVLILGYGIDRSRLEAVSINTQQLIHELQDLGMIVHVQNIGYGTEDFGQSMIDACLHRRRIIENLVRLVDELKITDIHDVFVLPLATILFTLELKKLRPKLRIIKELHNDYGHSSTFHKETLIRLIANQKSMLEKVIQSCTTYSRNLHIAKKYGLVYMSQPLKIRPFQRTTSDKIRISYLGHVLKKKGIFEFPELIRRLAKEYGSKVVWSFALSDLGDSASFISTLRSLASEYHLTIHIYGKVKPHDFFSRQDFYVLPIQDQFGAISTPNTILEAMEAGAIPVVTRMPSLEGIVSNNKTGILVSNPSAVHIYSSIQNVLKKPVFQESLRRQARSFVKAHFAQKKVQQQLQGLYE